VIDVDGLPSAAHDDMNAGTSAVAPAGALSAPSRDTRRDLELAIEPVRVSAIRVTPESVEEPSS